MKLNFRRQAGATLIETMMVVALMAVITIGALVYFNSANESSKVQEATASLTALTSVIRNQFATQGDYTGLTADVAMRFGNVPENMLVRSGTGGASGTASRFRHPWNQNTGAVTIAPDTTNVANDSFTVTFTKVPAATCVDLMTRTFRHFDKAVAGTTTVTTVAQATSGCGSSGDVSMSWTAR
ncbi:type 4 pilus major pilin [Pseudomonas taiwanensis]|uniref:type 4 pilus major pilin n=1 Tax=Pseudomonas taiwanensis TaxID=470150 RepID=UPI0028E08263|nr:type 4 pilus major pilin [Pseudomonas taiwanensis]MDT8925001.1 type 4 pilus major pilin [Pseudomonas taiwanensis]